MELGQFLVYGLKYPFLPLIFFNINKFSVPDGSGVQTIQFLIPNDFGVEITFWGMKIHFRCQIELKLNTILVSLI